MNYKKLLITVGCSLILFFSWWSLPATREIWDILDNAVFTTLNGSLAEKSWWSYSWAIANHRSFDLTAAFFMFVILLSYARKGETAEEFNKRISTILTGIIYVVISTQLIKLVLSSYDRESASRTIKGATLLSDLYPGIDPKDSSKNSFPGDHAIILFSYTALMFYYGKIRYGLPSLAISIFFSLPRLFSGAHWFTDIAVGSTFMSSLSLGIYMCTPVCTFCETTGNRIYSKLPLTGTVSRWLSGAKNTAG